MKALVTFLFCITIFATGSSQNTIWGTTITGGNYNSGYLYRTDSLGDHLTIVHHFKETVDGKSPGPVIQASNGKLYGMTTLGGQGVVSISGPNSTTISTQGGTLFEYDPVTDNFTTLSHFNSTDPQYPTGFYAPSGMKILEATPGKLWCVFNVSKPYGAVSSPAPRYILSYDVATNSMTPVGMLPSWTTPYAPSSTFNTSYTGELYKSANGFIYGTTGGYSACATTDDPSWGSMGSVIRIHPLTYAFSYIRPFPCSTLTGWLPESNLAETGAKLYGSTRWGGPNVTTSFNGHGVIFEFDPAANTFAKKHDFPGAALGGYPNGYLITGTNGKLYGTSYGGTPYQNFPNGSGIIFEYDPVSDIYSKKYDFTDGGTMDIGRLGTLWLKAHSGKLYGTTMNGIFEYTVLSDQTRAAGRFNSSLDSPNPIIEICRKPAYKTNTTNSYTICENSFFTYDVNCDNAKTIVWKQNGTAISTQTSSLLSFNQIASSDAGTWVCEMTNDCGTTISPTFTLIINAAGTGVVTSTLSPAGTTTICPNSSITLSGNNGGTWNTGSANAGINVTQPGSYQVVNTNACGQTYSNIITIDTVPTPVMPIITFTPTGTYVWPVLTQSMCPGDSLLLVSNIPGGVWNTGQTTPSVYVKDLLPHYITNTNQCTSVVSATAQAAYFAPVPAPVTAQSGTVQACAGDSALLTATATLPISWYRMLGANYSFVGNGSSIYIKQTGNYYARITTLCGNVYSAPVHVNADTLALGAAVISASGTLTFCPGGSVTLTSNHSNCVWSTGQTSQSITVNQTGNYYVTNMNSCSSKVSVITSVSVISTPPISYSQPQVPVCLATPAFTLAQGSPAGGYYTGNGVTGNTFDPALAGSGTHTVTYNVLDAATNCASIASQTIFVEYEPYVIIAGPSSTICAGTTAVLIQQNSIGTWNTGQTGAVLTTTAAGSYYVTHTNLCGYTVSSNTIQLTVNPLPPTPVITQNGTVLEASPGQAYQWYFNGSSIPGATSQTYAPTQNGDYSVYVAGTNGCYAPSALYPYVVTGIAQYANAGTIEVFPNPTTGYVTVKTPQGKSNIRVINSVGQVIDEQITGHSSEINFQVHQNGIYVVEIVAGNQRYIKKLVVYNK